MQLKPATCAFLVGLPLSGMLSFWVGSYVFAQSPTSIVPFTAHISKHYYKVGKDNELPKRLTVDYARRGDRSHVSRNLEIAPDGSSDFLVEIVNVQLRAVTTLEPFTKSKTTFLYSPEQFTRFVSSQDEENCPGNPDITETMRVENSEVRFGRPVRYARSQHLAPSFGSIDEERWTVRELNCFPVKRVDTRADGARTEVEVEALSEGEPDPGLFKSPGDYVERSPLAMEAAYMQKFGGVGFYGDAAAKSLDMSYWKHRTVASSK